MKAISGFAKDRRFNAVGRRCVVTLNQVSLYYHNEHFKSIHRSLKRQLAKIDIGKFIITFVANSVITLAKLNREPFIKAGMVKEIVEKGNETGVHRVVVKSQHGDIGKAVNGKNLFNLENILQHARDLPELIPNMRNTWAALMRIMRSHEAENQKTDDVATFCVVNNSIPGVLFPGVECSENIKGSLCLKRGAHRPPAVFCPFFLKKNNKGGEDDVRCISSVENSLMRMWAGLAT